MEKATPRLALLAAFRNRETGEQEEIMLPAFYSDIAETVHSLGADYIDNRPGDCDISIRRLSVFWEEHFPPELAMPFAVCTRWIGDFSISEVNKMAEMLFSNPEKYSAPLAEHIKSHGGIRTISELKSIIK